MPFVPVPNVAQAELVCLWDTQRCQNVLHYSKASPWTVDHMEELAAGLIEKWETWLQPSVTSTLSLVSVGVADLSAQNAPAIEYTTGLPLAGEAESSPSLPNNVSCVFTKRTALRGRSYRGRIYHMGFVESQVTGNALIPSVTTALTSAYSQFMSVSLPVAVDEAILCVVSRYTGGDPRSEGIATPVTAITSDGIIDSQRRRLPGRGQ